jgi:hypothetical protein
MNRPVTFPEPVAQGSSPPLPECGYRLSSGPIYVLIRIAYMTTPSSRRCALLLWGLFWAQASWTQQWVAVNDHGPGPGTHPNATRYNALGTDDGSSGPLRDLITGTNLPVVLTITRSGFVNNDPFGADPPAGTPLLAIFDGLVDFAGNPTNNNFGMARGPIPPAGMVTFTLSGLDPAKSYVLQGGAVRGEPAYTNRWTLFELSGTDTFQSSHSAGTLTTAQVDTLASNQVAINTGVNHLPGTGDMFEWWDVSPGSDGVLQIICRSYTGAVPGGSSGGAVAYAPTALRVQEYVQGTPVIEVQPQGAEVYEGDRVTFKVQAAGYPL